MTNHSKKRRPLGFRLLMLEISLILIRSWGRIGVVLGASERYQAIEKAPSLPLYIGVNVWWGCVYAALLFGLWRRKKTALTMVWGCLASYALYELLWWRVFARSAYDRERFAFWVLLAVAIMAMNSAIIWRKAFGSFFTVDPALEASCGDEQNDRYAEA